jgi:hypothetical protein
VLCERSANATTWGSSDAQCPTGYSFVLPVNGYENSQLTAVLRASAQPSSSVWINHKASLG